MSLTELAGRILAKEGKPADQKVIFFRTDAQPVKGTNLQLRYIIVDVDGIEFPPGLYAQVNCTLKKFRSSPRLQQKIRQHILRDIAEASQTDAGNAIRFANTCFTLSPDSLILKIESALPSEAPSLQGEALRG